MTTTNLPLSLLDPGGDINARSKGERDVSIESLANSIEQLGLLQPLLVRQEGERYRVIDGNRRLAALSRVANGAAAELTVPVLVFNVDDSDAYIRSLAANIERLPMHEVDQYEAFARVEAQGQTVADIARLFGVGERKVKQRLALGNLPAEIRNEYRAGNITPETMRLIANADIKLVKKVWKDGLRGWQLSDALRPARQNTLHPDSDIAEFIGRDRYVAEGGTFVTDLFVDEDEQLWANPDLAKAIAERMKIERCEQLVAEGWSFAEPTQSSWVNSSEHPQGEVDKKKFTDKAAFNEWKILKKELDQTPDDEEHADIRDDLIDHMAQIENEFDARVWSDEQKTRLGVVITPNFDIVYGVELPTSGTEMTATEAQERFNDQQPAEPKEEGPAPISNSLLMDLEMHITHAAQRAVNDDRRLALVLMVDEFWQRKSQLGYVQRKLSLHYDDYRGTTGQPVTHGIDFIEGIAKKAGVNKAKSFAGRIKAWMKLEDEDIDQAAAYFISQSLVNTRPSAELVQYLEETGRLKIGETWLPTVEDFFARLTKPQLIQIAIDNGIEVMGSMKKGELATIVRDKLPADWLPKEIQP